MRIWEPGPFTGDREAKAPTGTHGSPDLYIVDELSLQKVPQVIDLE